MTEPLDPRADPSGPKRSFPPGLLPKHIAFIMDGNGRWARKRGFLRIRGHEQGAASLRRITRYARSIGIAELTFFALSTENYRRRPEREVNYLLQLLKSYLASERLEMITNGIHLHVMGHCEEFPADVLDALDAAEEATAGQTKMILRLALNYGGRREILDAVASIASDIEAGRLSAGAARTLGEEGFRRYLYEPGMSDPDLLIRTAGELRLSNFLLWQCSYSEIWVTPQYWPDFDVPDLEKALESYCARERKYGAIGASESTSDPAGEGETSGHGSNDRPKG